MNLWFELIFFQISHALLEQFLRNEEWKKITQYRRFHAKLQNKSHHHSTTDDSLILTKTDNEESNQVKAQQQT